jgi:hypothetical protein
VRDGKFAFLEGSVGGAQGDNGDDARVVGTLSDEFRKLDGVSVTDTQPALNITCVVIQNTYHLADDASWNAASVAATTVDRHLITHLVQTASTTGRCCGGSTDTKGKVGVHSLTRI